MRGLRTLEWKLPSFWLTTIRRAWLAVNIFSLGGDPEADIEAVGLRRRWLRDAESESEWTCDARETEPERFRARLILALSLRSACQVPADGELLLLAGGVLVADSIICSEERLVRFEAFIGRRGDFSESEDEGFVLIGRGGEPSVFLDRNPAWKRFTFGLISRDVSGAVGIGEESCDSSFHTFVVMKDGKAGKTGLESSVTSFGLEDRSF